ncbi:MAG: PIN domain-containing protein [Chthoniobacterales bacterium]|nr:PIN domain-containing protein [Chthoniobacterales bacterium]
MILLDANLLIYAHSARMPQHEVARAWLDETLSKAAPVGFPWPSLMAFLRVLSSPRAVPAPSSLPDLWQQVQEWLSRPGVWIPGPQESHAEIFASLLPFISRPELVADAHLAALAIEYNLTLCSADGDFARFPRLRWENPLLPKQPRR